ncbi:MAG: DNA-binding protein [Methanomicrobiaceae archaeon]|nr:DNA-binding protein [Methanomicrobiaceae archaeon]
MEYAEGRPGRVFVMRVDDGEELLGTITEFLKEKEVTSGAVFFLGALKEGNLVVGPKEPVIPPVPCSIIVEGGWEMIGIGTVYPGGDGPSIHIHTSMGRKDKSVTGCLREFAEVYLVAEVIILEFTGISVARVLNTDMGIHLPVFNNHSASGLSFNPEKD